MKNSALDSLSVFAKPVEPRVHGPGHNWAAQHPEELKWINTSNFDFAQKMRDAYMRWGQLTEGQLAAVRKCMAFAAQKQEIKRTYETPAYADVNALDLSHVPAGMYAVPDGATRLKVKIAKPTGGKWGGWIFVSDGALYGHGSNYGSQRPGGKYQGQILDQLMTIAANPALASAAYGKLTGTCGICGRPLENAESVERGIGPICAGRMGW